VGGVDADTTGLESGLYIRTHSEAWGRLVRYSHSKVHAASDRTPTRLLRVMLIPYKRFKS
jgi:hypothetical protein